MLISVYLLKGIINKFKRKEKIQNAEKFYIDSEAASIVYKIHNPLLHSITK